jgi:NAD(P)H-dependent FMN reductase
MTKIAIIVGSTRPVRIGEGVAHWVRDTAAKRDDATFELIDVRDFDLPFVDSVMPPAMLGGQYGRANVHRWADTIASYDGYVFVTPENNHGIAAGLKNAIDWLYPEWNNKAAGFVAYGQVGGARAVEQLRQVLAAVKIATVAPEVSLSLTDDFRDFQEFIPSAGHEDPLTRVLDAVVAWSGAMRTLRTA